MSNKTRNAIPNASSLLESLRGLGYSTASALADIVDNSISAGATVIDLYFIWDGENSNICILDNGIGMSDTRLEYALKLGDRHPLETRDPKDLGRFGMGLKTASFSQCKRLTVASKTAELDSINCLRWDLALLSENPSLGWVLFEGVASESASLLDFLKNRSSGTLVIWELLDRILTSGFASDDFFNLIDAIEHHLSMVFHRFIGGSEPILQIKINNKKIEAWDPFMTGHPSKSWVSPVQKYHSNTGMVEIQSHVLPHKDKLTIEDFERNAGSSGWISNQGFYVYRGNRLLVAGGWLGLGYPKAWGCEAVYQLARIKVDLPNSADTEWKIDIKKSVARVPINLKKRLLRIAEDTREKAKNVFVKRGGARDTNLPQSVQHAWKVVRTSDEVRYLIDKNHPLIKNILETATNLQKDLIICMLRVIEETVPIQKIWLDTVDQKFNPKINFTSEASSQIFSIMETIFNDMLNRSGMTSQDAKKLLTVMEPFNNYPDLISRLPIDN